MDYKSEYRKKLLGADGVASMIGSGWTCVTDAAAAIPPAILEALGRRAEAGDVKDLTFHGLLDLMPNAMFSYPGVFTPVSWFSGKIAKAAANRGEADIMPCCYRDMPGLYRDYIHVDAFMIVVSPMDADGFFSAGVTGSYTAALFEKAEHIFLEVNPKMPRAVTAPKIHISQVTALCESDAPLPILPPAQLDDVSRTIGGYIAEEVPSGATLQLGIGAVPEAVGLALKGKHDLGIHTELLPDSMIELIECGAVTNMKKPIHTGKTVATFTFGSERLYKFVDNNPDVEILPVDYVNDPAVIAKHPNFISVNGGLEVDFFGQVCAESIGTVHVSGTGGQTDYVRGAIQSPGGKSFIAFPSTAAGGTVSRIRPTLNPGARVSTSKNDVDYIATEYGLAKLRGKTVSQRTKALIAIAHPKFREELTAQAKAMHILI